MFTVSFMRLFRGVMDEQVQFISFIIFNKWLQPLRRTHLNMWAMLTSLNKTERNRHERNCNVVFKWKSHERDVCDSLGGVYMRKLAPARVSHWDDFLISYRVYMMTGSFHTLLFNDTFRVDKIHIWVKRRPYFVLRAISKNNLKIRFLKFC